MARGKSSHSTVKKDVWKFKGFINHEFEAQEIVEMLQWFDDRTFDHSEMLMSWTDEGWKTSQSYDDSRNLYIFSATAKKTDSDLDGWVLQLRHTDMHRLLCAAAYVVGVLLPNGAIKPGSEEDDKFNW